VYVFLVRCLRVSVAGPPCVGVGVFIVFHAYA
jgi:hypothetical protein